jgi:hypothetical protein
VKRLIEFELAEGGTVVVEVDDEETGLERAARPGEIAEKAGQTFESALDRIKPAAEAILQRLSGLAKSPDEIQVEFGVKLSGKLGAVIASVDAEATYKVTLKWNAKTLPDQG